MPDHAWTTEVPTEPGYYWFYGTSDTERRCGLTPWLRFVTVRPPTEREQVFLHGLPLLYIYEGCLIYPESHRINCYWQRIPTPTLPEVTP